MTAIITPTSRRVWLNERRRGIGASDAPAVLGISPWSSPFSVWLDKTGQNTEDDQPTDSMEWGLRLEDAIAGKWEEVNRLRLDKVVHDDGRPKIAVHPDLPWMMASLDRLCVDGNPFEAKTATWFDEGWDRIAEGIAPDHVRVQQQHQMAVMGAQVCYGAVLIDGRSFHEWEERRDEAMIQAIIDVESRFWRDHVEAGTPPPIDGSAATSEAIKSMFPESIDGLEVDLPPVAYDVIDRWVNAKAARKAAKEIEDEAANQLRVLLGDAAVGRVGGVKAVTWKSHDQHSIDPEMLRDTYPDVAAACTKTTTVRTLLKARGFTL